MSNFEVKVKQISKVEHHPNADLLDLVYIDDYVCIVGRDNYVATDMVVYIPEAAVVPEWLLEEIGLVGKLAGKAKNRVKAMKLRGIVSLGLIYPLDKEWAGVYTIWNGGKNKGTRHPQTSLFIGDDVTEFLGITKYEPPIPSSMSGEVFNAFGKTINFDIENIKKYPDVLEDGEEISITEKLHGCISSDSLVMLPNGNEITIDEIISNDSYTEVLSYDVDVKKFITRKITGKFKRKNLEKKKWMMLTFANNRTLKITKDHPLYSNDRNKWIKAHEILPDEDIKSPI